MTVVYLPVEIYFQRKKEQKNEHFPKKYVTCNLHTYILLFLFCTLHIVKQNKEELLGGVDRGGAGLQFATYYKLHKNHQQISFYFSRDQQYTTERTITIHKAGDLQDIIIKYIYVNRQVVRYNGVTNIQSIINRNNNL